MIDIEWQYMQSGFQHFMRSLSTSHENLWHWHNIFLDATACNPVQFCKDFLLLEIFNI